GFIPQVERIVGERLGEPVSIGGLRFTLFPAPQLKIEQIAIGKGQDVRIGSALVALSPAALMDEKKEFDEVEINGLALDQDALPRLAAWTQAPPDKARLQVQRIMVNDVKLAIPGSTLPSFDATATLAKA